MARKHAIPPAPEPEKKKTDDKPFLVVMVRGEQLADVHPSEVENWKTAGWTIKRKE